MFEARKKQDRSSFEIKKIFLFFLFLLGWTSLFILPLHLDPENESWKIIFIPFSTFPLILTTIPIFKFTYALYNQIISDDYQINIFYFIIVILCWIVSWSSIYMNYWTWFPIDHPAFPILPEISNAYKAWAYMLGISAGIYSADQPPTADAHDASLALLIGIQSIASTWINVILLAGCVVMVYDRIKEAKEEKKKHADDSPINDGYGGYLEVTDR